MTPTAAQCAATTGIPTPSPRPGQLRWPADDVAAVVHRCGRLGWAAEEVADLLDLFAFQCVRRVAAYVARMSDRDLAAWRSDLPNLMADVRAHNAGWVGGTR